MAALTERNNSDAAMFKLLDQNDNDNNQLQEHKLLGQQSSDVAISEETAVGQEDNYDQADGFDQTLAELLFDAEQNEE